MPVTAAPARPSKAAHALFPGTFDPVTWGHLDVLERALALFGRVTVGLATHAEKTSLLTIEERLELLRAVLADRPGIEIVRIEGLVVDACRRLGATAIVRGVRSGTDFDYEVQMARSNRALAPEVDTVLVVPSPEHAHISSTLVRQIATLGGELAPFVPPSVEARLRARLRREP